MTDSDLTGQDSPAAPAPAAPWNPPAEHDPVTDQDRAAVVPRRRRRWVLLGLAAVGW
jgi:hypothetical protein